MRTITAADRPRYDGWGPDSPWTCDEWIAWHAALTAAHGADRADDIWASAWLDGLSRAGGGRGTARGAGAVFDSVPVDCRTINTAFARYVSARPKLQAAVWTGLGGAIMAPVAAIAQTSQAAGFGLQNIATVLNKNPALTMLALAGVAWWLSTRRR